ncbi:zinc finger, c4 type (two domains) domain-containing protein [Ditylenchus destructor]|nr:zinc finger, c4 type (two domains) domain-containing protein [Ditylenchus destructor]
MQAINNANLNPNSSELNTLHESLYSDSVSNALATSVDLSLRPTMTFFDSRHLTFTSGELQNGKLKPTNMKIPTKCLVCGHPANCCNFGVPSCNGCKMFFRRCLLTSKIFACKLNGMCSKINGINRCRACRFDQCVIVGMNPRAIQFPTTVDVVKLSDKVANRKTGPAFQETIEDNTIQSLVYVELKVRKIRESSRRLSESVIFLSIRELLESNRENVLANADQYPKELTWPLSVDEAARTMPVFSQLVYKDQEALLKHMTLTNALLLQAFYSWQRKSETFIMPNGYVRCMKLKKYDRLKEITERIKLIFFRVVLAMFRIQMTMEEFVLLKAIIYSHSAIHGLSERGRVLLEKECIRYSKTLMKHLQSRMGAAPGAKKYAEIVSFVGCLFYAAQQIRQIHIYHQQKMKLYQFFPWIPNMQFIFLLH